MSQRKPTPTGVIPLTEPVLRRFGNYYLVRKLAEGGMAEIFLAKQVGAEGFERDVVVKCMLEHFTNSREFVEMFLDEARLAARLHHPNVVQINDLGVADGRYYLCMEYLAGEDLQTVIERCAQRGEAVPLGVAARLILMALEGLEYAHGYSEGGMPTHLVHRDVSPSNLFVTFQGNLKVLDFGIAKASSKFVHTQPGTVKGKLGYMSPEQARGEPLDARSDLFSLGITFHELLTGRRVFQKNSEVGVLLAMMGEDIPAPSSLRPEIPAALDQIVARSTQRDVSLRYASAAQMREEVEAFLASHVSVGGTSHVATWVQRLFGPEAVQRRTQIPTLKELSARGYVLPPEPAATELNRVEKTFVRPATGAPDPRTAEAPDVEPGAEWVGPRTTLDADGRLVKPGAPSAPLPAALEYGSELEPPQLGGPQEDEPLQLLERPATGEVAAEPARAPGDGYEALPGRYQAPRRRRLFPVGVTLFLLLIAGAAAWVIFGRQGVLPRGLLPRSVQVPQGLEQQVRVLTIDSTPSGATVFINEVKLGQTPLLKENDYAAGAQVEVRLVLRGYRPWSGTFRGGAQAKIEARLVKR